MFNLFSKLVKRVRGANAMNRLSSNTNCDNKIIKDSYYLINYSREKHQPITQLKLQKLMYFVEAFYMNREDETSLYNNVPFKAWTFGPVALPLYSKYKCYGSDNIILTEEEQKEGNSICDDRKELIKEIVDFFGEYSAMQLVNFTHEVDSPWHKKWIENGERITYGPEGDIDKIQTKEWFKERFISE